MRRTVRIRITIGTSSSEAELADNETGRTIAAAIPFSGKAHRWGDEIYFDIPVRLSRAKDARDVLQPGELAYWPDGPAFCIFWGPTPSSKGTECRAYSPVNVFGKLIGAPAVFSGIRDGSTVTVEAA